MLSKMFQFHFLFILYKLTTLHYRKQLASVVRCAFVKELFLIFCQLFRWLNLLFVIWYLGNYRMVIIWVRCLAVQMRVNALTWGNWSHGGFCLEFRVWPYICFWKLILSCVVEFCCSDLCSHILKKTAWDAELLFVSFKLVLILFLLFLEDKPVCYQFSSLCCNI